MPGFIKTERDEKLWQEAKKIVKRQKDKNEDEMTSRDWGLVTHIWKNMKEHGTAASVMAALLAFGDSDDDEGYIIKTYRGKLYHGSTTPVTNWGLTGEGRLGKGLYLTPDRALAEFYSRGGRQGGGHHGKQPGGYVYEFSVNGLAAVIKDEDQFLKTLVSDYEPAEEAFERVGDYESTSITKLVAEWARDCGFGLVVCKGDGVLCQLPQVIVVVDGVAKLKKVHENDLGALGGLRVARMTDPIVLLALDRGFGHYVHSDSDDFSLLLSIGSDHNTREYFMSSAADSEWEHHKQSTGMEDEDRPEWASEQAQYYLDMGYPNSSYFDEPKLLKKSEWLIHFTNSDPQGIIDEGIRGREYDILGLTTHYKYSSYPGPFAFALVANDLTDYEIQQYQRKYGEDAVLFKADEAIKVYHSGDEEEQVIFVTDSVIAAYPLYQDKYEDLFTLIMPDSSEEQVGADSEGLRKAMTLLNDHQ